MSSVPTEDRLGELLLRWTSFAGRDATCPPGSCAPIARNSSDELRRRIEVVRGPGAGPRCRADSSGRDTGGRRS